jgi:hypothetical protein
MPAALLLSLVCPPSALAEENPELLNMFWDQAHQALDQGDPERAEVLLRRAFELSRFVSSLFSPVSNGSWMGVE